MDSVVVVLDESALCYVCKDQYFKESVGLYVHLLNQIKVPSVSMPFGINQWSLIADRNRIRPATREDFETFRVMYNPQYGLLES